MGTCCTKPIEGDTQTPVFTLDSEVIRAKVVYVYDGDTIHIVFPIYDLHGKKVIRKWKCRLVGIDTPELRTKDEKEQGYAIASIVRDLLLHQHIYVECGKFDKYGRLLVTIQTKGLKGDWKVHGRTCRTLNEWMIHMGYANEYDGGTKPVWSF